MANPITYQEIKDLLTQSDIFNGIDAGIVPTGTSSGEELIQQDLDLYEYLKTEGRSGQQKVSCALTKRNRVWRLVRRLR